MQFYSDGPIFYNFGKWKQFGMSLPTYPRQLTRQECTSVLISLVTSPVILKLNDFFIRNGPVIQKDKIVTFNHILRFVKECILRLWLAGMCAPVAFTDQFVMDPVRKALRCHDFSWSVKISHRNWLPRAANNISNILTFPPSLSEPGTLNLIPQYSYFHIGGSVVLQNKNYHAFDSLMVSCESGWLQFQPEVITSWHLRERCKWYLLSYLIRCKDTIPAPRIHVLSKSISIFSVTFETSLDWYNSPQAIYLTTCL